jgi:hypothetical protein
MAGQAKLDGVIDGVLRTVEENDVKFTVTVGGQGRSFSVPIPGKLKDFPPGDYVAFRWDPKSGFTFRFKDVRPGRRLVYARWRESRYFDWAWVDVSSSSAGAEPAKLALRLDPDVHGIAEVACPGAPDGALVAFALPDTEGKTGSWGTQPRSWECGAAVVSGIAVFKGLRPGRYVFYPALPEGNVGIPGSSAPAEVRAGETARITLPGVTQEKPVDR